MGIELSISNLSLYWQETKYDVTGLNLRDPHGVQFPTT